MNDQQCRQFIGELIAAYPSIESLAKSNSPDLASTHRGWAKPLRDLEFVDCMAVLDKLQRGIFPQPTFEDKESPGVWIRRHVQRMLGQRSEAEIVQQRDQVADKRKRQRDYAAAGYSMAAALEAMRIGKSIDEVMRMV